MVICVAIWASTQMDEEVSSITLHMPRSGADGVGATVVVVEVVVVVVVVVVVSGAAVVVTSGSVGSAGVSGTVVAGTGGSVTGADSSESRAAGATGSELSGTAGAASAEVTLAVLSLIGASSWHHTEEPVTENSLCYQNDKSSSVITHQGMLLLFDISFSAIS